MNVQTRDRRSRHTFWIDDRVVDTFGPVMGRFPFGATALAVYAVLARRADRDGDSWPSLNLIAGESGASTRTVHKALRLLELLGLVEIASCYERGSQRQTSNLYTLLTPPERPLEIDPDPDKWPPPTRRSLLVGNGSRAESVAAARIEQRALVGERSTWAGLAPVSESATPPQSVHPLPRTLCIPPAQSVHPPDARGAPLEGDTFKDNTRKEESSRDGKRAKGTPGDRGHRPDDEDGPLTDSPTSRLPDSVPPSFTIEEVGLTNRQVWAATLGELARRGDVGRGELESWLRPAALIGRDGSTLIVGAPNAVTRDRIATRLLPAVREALGATIGVPVAVAVEVIG
jgi:hypothetical protein